MSINIKEFMENKKELDAYLVPTQRRQAEIEKYLAEQDKFNKDIAGRLKAQRISILLQGISMILIAASIVLHIVLTSQ